ncbi:hypothetical protein C9374_013896 [Naegleria lovaniensis]|uniref:Uncharacterized protein n=1 Tax=Naegleria lovaniensis TaxID=51637 RepID=A0AA88KQ54_NAELO|nr:uncharacterized protein C9374_013896 [Naegleria lovaniensis]KAG2389336.1 hypothetical protein C9374_013896 [Naegleria lovaniensis]
MSTVVVDETQQQQQQDHNHHHTRTGSPKESPQQPQQENVSNHIHHETTTTTNKNPLLITPVVNNQEASIIHHDIATIIPSQLFQQQVSNHDGIFNNNNNNNNNIHHSNAKDENFKHSKSGENVLNESPRVFREADHLNNLVETQQEPLRLTCSTIVDFGGLVGTTATPTNHETPIQAALSNVKAEKKDHRKHKRLKKTLQDQHDDDPTEKDMDLADADLHFTPDELEMLQSDPHISKKKHQNKNIATQVNSSSSTHSISHSYEATRPRLTIEQQQQILVSLHALNLNEMQRKELRLLGDVIRKITEDEMFKCTTFESVNIYLFILIISATASALGTLALALIYFIVFRGSMAEAIFSAAISGVFVVSIISCVGVCVFYNMKNRPKNKKQKAAIAHYHEIVEEVFYNIGTRFFPDFEIDFDYIHVKQDGNTLEERKKRLERVRRNRHKKLLSRFYRQQIQAYLGETFMISQTEQPQLQEASNPHELAHGDAPQKESPPIASTTDTMWYSVCCIFGGFCTLIIVLILILFSFICLFFPLIFKRPPIVPIFITIPIQVGYGVVAAMVLGFLIFLCFFSCTLYCYAFAGKDNSWKCLCCSLETAPSHYSDPYEINTKQHGRDLELGNAAAVNVIEHV